MITVIKLTLTALRMLTTCVIVTPAFILLAVAVSRGWWQLVSVEVLNKFVNLFSLLMILGCTAVVICLCTNLMVCLLVLILILVVVQLAILIF